MDFRGPEPADLDDVRSLNHAFLNHLRAEHCGRALREQLRPALQPLISGLSDLQIRRLAASPFLLLSLRERDDNYWARLFADDPNADLFASRPPAGDDSGRIAAAALGFLWQLARRNPYAARLVCNASLNWCEQLAARTLLRLLQQAADRSDLLAPRCADDAEFWGRLLGSGLSSERTIRRAAQLCALQTILTQCDDAGYGRVRAAACSTALPTLHVAERHNRT